MKPIVVLGSGLAAYTVIREFRKLNASAPIIMVTRDNGDYYSKPTLSNAFAQGKVAANLVLTPASAMAQQLDFTLMPHTEVRTINRSAKNIDTSSGVIEYDKLVLALGADPIRIPLQGNAAEAVLSVNDLADYARLREALVGVKSVAIMGGGLIGCEFANDLASAGFVVTVIDPGPYPLASLLSEHAGKQLLEPLENLGVSWRFGTSIKTMDSQTSGYVLGLADGTTILADLVLSAVGLRPRIRLAQEAGLSVNRGIVVNKQLCSNDPSIFALGDCAEIDGNVLPYVLPIMHSGKALARILNNDEAKVIFPAMPVVVKTPAHPIAVLPVARNAAGTWQVLAPGLGIKMGFFNEHNKMTGFALTGEFASERNEMIKQIATSDSV